MVVVSLRIGVYLFDRCIRNSGYFFFLLSFLFGFCTVLYMYLDWCGKRFLRSNLSSQLNWSLNYGQWTNKEVHDRGNYIISFRSIFYAHAMNSLTERLLWSLTERCCICIPFFIITCLIVIVCFPIGVLC